MDLVDHTATELLHLLRTAEVSSREVLDAHLARVAAVNPSINAVVALDEERARSWASAADEATARGDAVGPLHGLPMTIKDVWETEGLVTTSGAPELRDHVPATDAVTVARLKAAGAIVFGKTNVPLYAGDIQTYNEVYGLTRNPWDLDRTTGGSSGGAAAALAAGLTPLELGSDIGGSIRAPSHFCGVYGMKPTWGLVPSRGHIPGPPGSLVEPDVNSGGPMARSVEDLELAFGLLAGPLPEDEIGWHLDLPAAPAAIGDGLRGVRVAVVFDDPTFRVATEVQDALRGFASRLEAAGARVEEVSLPVPVFDGFTSWMRLVLPILGSAMPDDAYDVFASLAGMEADDMMTIAGQSLASTYRAWARADALRQRQRHRWARFFDDHDVVLTPVMPTAAFGHDVDGTMIDRTVDIDGVTQSHTELIGWCGAIGSALLPVVVIPAGRTATGLPVGVQIVGPHLRDRSVLAFARHADAHGAGPGRPSERVRG